MEQSKIEEIIDESFNHLIDTMIKFPENPYNINFEEIFFKGKADLIHKLEKIINQKDKQIDLMAKHIACLDNDETICKKLYSGNICEDKKIVCWECIKQYFKEIAERKSEEWKKI